VPQVTAVTPQKKNFRVGKTPRFNIFVDGKFALGMSADELILKKIKVGSELQVEDLLNIKKTDEEARFYNLAIGYIARRPRSEKELRDYLFRKKVEEAITEKIIEKMRRLNFINDTDFAIWWVNQRQESSRPKGERAIKFELYRKGIAKEIIEEAFSSESLDGTEKVSELDLALKSGSKKEKSLNGLEKRKFYEKLARFLAGKGFNWEITKQAIEILWEKWYNGKD